MRAIPRESRIPRRNNRALFSSLDSAVQHTFIHNATRKAPAAVPLSIFLDRVLFARDFHADATSSIDIAPRQEPMMERGTISATGTGSCRVRSCEITLIPPPTDQARATPATTMRIGVFRETVQTHLSSVSQFTRPTLPPRAVSRSVSCLFYISAISFLYRPLNSRMRRRVACRRANTI